MAKILRRCRSNKFTIRLTPEERSFVNENAQLLGLSETVYGRDKLLAPRHTRSLFVPQVNREIYQELALLRVELCK